MFSGHSVVHATNPTLDQRPKSFNRVRVNVALHVYAFRMLNTAMLHVSASGSGQIVVGGQLIREYFRRCQHTFMDESVHRWNSNISDRRSKDTSPTLDSANYNRFVLGAASCPACWIVSVARFAAVIGFVDFDRGRSAKLLSRVLRHQFRADQVEHAPRGFIGHAKLALQLLCDQRLYQWRDFYSNHFNRWLIGEQQEEKTGATFRSPSRDSYPASLHELAKEFERRKTLRGDGKRNQRNLLFEDAGAEKTACRVCRL